MIGTTTNKVTVLMPVYNGEVYLREAIDSILGQTLTTFELLVINDGSTDATAEILADYAGLDARVRVINQPNAGIVSALNAGLEVASGTYIARMDADDIAHPQRLAIQTHYMDAHPACVACGSDYELIGARRGRVRTPRTNAQCQARLLIESCFAHPTVMLRTTALRAAGLQYDQAFQYAEDYRLWTRLAPHGDLANISEPLLRYRLHPGQVSISKQRLQRERHAAAAVAHLERYGNKVELNEFKQFLWPESSYPISYLRLAISHTWALYKTSRNVNSGIALTILHKVVRNLIKILITKIRNFNKNDSI